MLAFKTLHDWAPEPGVLTSWVASPGTKSRALQAPRSAVPPSAQQTHHLRNFIRHEAEGRDMARLLSCSWDVEGTCDIEAMTYAMNAHVRRHDTYHSWFEYVSDAEIYRRTFTDPADIEIVPTEHGFATADDVRTCILQTPDFRQWDCFNFGIIQRPNDFTIYLSFDHLLSDASSGGVVFLEIHMMYAALLSGAGPLPLPEQASYENYCVRQRTHTDALTLESPEIRKWIEFATRNGSSLPEFPLPLGDHTVPSTGAMIVVPLIDEEQTTQFEANCAEAGVRFSGGVMACSALVEHEVTGTDTYFGITSYDTRTLQNEYMTPGWFASVIPITVPVAGQSFDEIARAAQHSFDSAKDLGNVPFDRVLELAPPELGLRKPVRDVPMVAYIDVRAIPLSEHWETINGGIYGDSRLSDQVCMWVDRFETGCTLTLSFPENPIARESVLTYLDVVRSVFARAASQRARTGQGDHRPTGDSG